MAQRYSKGEFFTTPNKSNLRGQDPAVQVLFMWLSDHSDDNDQSFPSRNTLASECGISVRTMDRAMEKLIKLGLVQKKARYNGNEQTTNLYRCVILAPPRVNLTRGGDKSALGGDKNDTQNSTHLTQPIEVFDTKVSNGVPPVEKVNKQVQELFDFWATCTGQPIRTNVAKNRQAGYRLFNAYGIGEAKSLIQAAANSQGEKFAPVIGDLVSLDKRSPDLQVWRKRNVSAQQSSVNVGALLHPEKYGRELSRV